MIHRRRLLPVLRQLLVCASAVALVVVWWPLGTAAPVGAATPVLAVTPDRGPCGTRVTTRGEAFPAGATIAVFVLYPAPRPPGGGGQQVAQLSADAAGAFAVALPIYCGPDEPEGTQFRIVAQAVPDGPAASAAFTISTAPQCFRETGHCLGGRFLTHWALRGGLAINGYPISAEFVQRLEDGKEYTVQYFERVRLEHHPENAYPYDVLLGQFGRRFHPPDPPVPQRPGGLYFPETGHNLRGRFADYWVMHGGLDQFGYPLSEEFTERLEDGREYTVQYFERARFEHHPENPAPYDVLLGQFGRRVLAESGR